MLNLSLLSGNFYCTGYWKLDGFLFAVSDYPVLRKRSCLHHIEESFSSACKHPDPCRGISPVICRVLNHRCGLALELAESPVHLSLARESGSLVKSPICL